eukprot:TRINITY_DN20973_c0_g1_i1.p1 TRINITY_DN20973_c0_g1~~TRINITY_DN20973_c0_g1_i1.p1  ORF type:complete len:428 (+),score=109.38 TRINITY_DN20973_c0_g1_i1:60-1343(+)
MKACLSVMCLVSAAAGYPAAYVDANEAALWKTFKATYNKSYTGAQEEDLRRAVFKANMLKAAALEAENPMASFGMNIFSDLSAEEFKVRHNLQFPKRANPPKAVAVDPPAPVDWRAKGAVTPVRDQGMCSSNWAIAATGNIEGQWFLAGHNLTAVSVQELISCDTYDNGCNGGSMQSAWHWLILEQDGWIATDAAYPYTSMQGSSGTCKLDISMQMGANIVSYESVASDEDVMAAWVSANGPLAVAVDASTWQFYTGGVMSNCNGRAVDHAALIVGFAADYWIVKNSWGTSWGENGYVRLAKGSNQCNIKDQPCSANVTADGYWSTSQTVCSDSACTKDCQNYWFRKSDCLLRLGGGGATITACGGSGINYTWYPFTDCGGFPLVDVMPVNSCISDGQGSYFMNACGLLPNATRGLTVRVPRPDRDH